MIQIARKPSSSIAALVAFVVAAFWISLRVFLFRDITLPLTYVLPLMVCVWTRRYWHLWTMATLFALAAAVKQFIVLPTEALPEWADWVTLSITLINIGFGTLVIAAIMRMRSRLEAQAQHLSDRNAEISAQAQELSQQNEEIAQQSKELARRNEEMQSQAKELGRQNEALHKINDTLGRREDLLQVLLDLARKPATGDRSLHEMCRRMITAIGSPAISIALVERQGDELVVSGAAGPEGTGDLQSVWSYAGSIAELVIRERRTARIDDLAARPGITVPCHRGTTVRSVLTAPLLSRNATTGAVIICGSEVHHWTDEQVHIAQWIASQCSLILEARLWQDELREVALLPEQNPDAVIRVLTGGTVIYANPAGVHMLRERGSGLDHGAPDELWMPAQEVFRSGRTTDREIQVGDRTYAVRYVPVVDREYVNIYAHDMTRRKKAEDRLRSVLDQSLDLVYRRDLRIDQYDYISPSCTQVFGISPSEMVHLGTDELLRRMHPDDLPAVRKAIAAADQDGSASVQYRLRLPDGQWHWMADHVRIIRDSEGSPIYRSGSVRDITEQVESREQLRRHAEQLQKLMDVVPVAIWVSDDPECRHVTGNRVANEFYEAQAGENVSAGISGGEVVGPRRYFKGDRELTPGELPMQYAVSHNVEVKGEELEVLTPSGRRIAIFGSAIPLRDEQGKVRGCLAAFLNITHLKEAQEALNEAKNAAEAASQAKDQFLATLSHELRTPLTPVLTAAALMEKDARLSPEIREDAAMIRRNVALETRLIDDLLDLTRISRGKLQLSVGPVNICDLLRHTAEICSPEADAKGLKLTLDLSQIQGCIVDGDSARLQQVFWNIIKNAVKFTPDGGSIALDGRMMDGEGESYAVAVDITDTGRGIDPIVLPRLFNAFEQGDPAVTRQFGGLGLGLTICRSLLDLHGGAIEARSDGLGKGATFRVILPLSDSVPIAAKPPAAATVPQQPVPQQKLCILLVEDHEDTAKLMARVLKMAGHTVYKAADMASGLELAKTVQFDLILSDLGLPDGSGLDLMRHLRFSGRTFKAIALSGYGTEEDLRKSTEAGFNAHLTKPVSLENLTEVIRKVTAEPECTKQST